MKYKYWKDQTTLPVVGNGTSLGLTNGTLNYGLISSALGSGGYCITGAEVSYGQVIGERTAGATIIKVPGNFGITPDPQKSGIVADVTNANEETKFKLYFYVGEFQQDAIKQTASLNAEMFNEKLDVNHSNDTKPYLKECFVDGASGYNIWSNGYCEQWGRDLGKVSTTTRTIELVKTYMNTEYNIQVSEINDITGNAYNLLLLDANTTENSFSVYGPSLSSIKRGVYWKTCGYLAQGQY